MRIESRARLRGPGSRRLFESTGRPVASVAVIETVVLFVAALMLPADIYIKTNVHTDAFEMMGQKQPAKDETTDQWLNEKQLFVKQGERVTILDLGKNAMYILNLKEKNYVEAALPLDMAKLLPPEAASMASMMKISVKICPGSSFSGVLPSPEKILSSETCLEPSFPVKTTSAFSTRRAGATSPQ